MCLLNVTINDNDYEVQGGRTPSGRLEGAWVVWGGSRTHGLRPHSSMSEYTPHGVKLPCSWSLPYKLTHNASHPHDTTPSTM